MLISGNFAATISQAGPSNGVFSGKCPALSIPQGNQVAAAVTPDAGGNLGGTAPRKGPSRGFAISKAIGLGKQNLATLTKSLVANAPTPNVVSSESGSGETTSAEASTTTAPAEKSASNSASPNPTTVAAVKPISSSFVKTGFIPPRPVVRTAIARISDRAVTDIVARFLPAARPVSIVKTPPVAIAKLKSSKAPKPPKVKSVKAPKVKVAKITPPKIKSVKTPKVKSAKGSKPKKK